MHLLVEKNPPENLHPARDASFDATEGRIPTECEVEGKGLVLPRDASLTGCTLPLQGGNCVDTTDYNRLRRSFRWYGITILMLFTWMVCVQITNIYLVSLQGEDIFRGCCGSQGWAIFLRSFGMQAMLVGLLCLIMFYALHRNFFAMAKDEESFTATPAIFNHATPFRERVFIEWLISFGLFVVAILIVFLRHACSISWIPRSPLTLVVALALLFALTLGAAVLNARLPILRWLVNPIVIVLLFASIFLIERSNSFLGWKFPPFQNFFDSAQSYPVLFGLMILDAVIVFATVTTMILGILYLRWKDTNRFFSRRTIRMIFGVEIATILVVSAFLYVPARIPCLADILVCRYRDDGTSHHNNKMTALASEIIRSTSETERRFGWAHGIRAEMYLRERKYDEAIADYDVAIRLLPDNSVRDAYMIFYCNSRGEAKFCKGDYAGALEDFDTAISHAMNYTNRDCHYNRGFAHEKLGNIEAALADYDKVIENAKRFREKPSIVSKVPRLGYDEESRCRVHERNFFGYVITFEELVEIRERLERDK
jgi:tetratricopeptide (TPR) repeat protein